MTFLKIVLSLGALNPFLSAHAASFTSEQISDRIAAEETVEAVFMGTDNKDWPALRDLFTDKVNFDMSSLTKEKPAVLTPAQITAKWETGLKEIQAIHHQPGNFRFKIQGDQAEVHCYGIAFHYKPNPSGKNTRTFVGTYDFHLTRIKGAWKVDSIRYNSQFVDGNLNL